MVLEDQWHHRWRHFVLLFEQFSAVTGGIGSCQSCDVMLVVFLLVVGAAYQWWCFPANDGDMSDGVTSGRVRLEVTDRRCQWAYWDHKGEYRVVDASNIRWCWQEINDVISISLVIDEVWLVSAWWLVTSLRSVGDVSYVSLWLVAPLWRQSVVWLAGRHWLLVLQRVVLLPCDVTYPNCLRRCPM